MIEPARLVMNQGPKTGETFVLDKDVIALGRAPTNDIVIAEPQVSRQHARIVRQGDVLVLEDLGSTNGTFVNGIRLVSPHVLVGGDVIALGDAVRFTYYAPGRPAEGRTTIPVETPPGEQWIRPDQAPQYPPPYVQEVQPRAVNTNVKWLWIGCGCLVLLCVTACAAVLILDYFKLLPDFFYQPLFWLGLDKYFIR
jgi:pSer/pThr/pTyr-binding forkhead associated (FHA) protein